MNRPYVRLALTFGPLVALGFWVAWEDWPLEPASAALALLSLGLVLLVVADEWRWNRPRK